MAAERPRAAERLKKVARGKREARGPWIVSTILISPGGATDVRRRRTQNAEALLLAQRLLGVDAHGAARREIAGEERDQYQEQ